MKGVPIKFRGKRVKDGKTVYGWAYKSNCPMSSFPAIIDDDDKYNAVYPDSVAQLLGYDKNGAEIYEGDEVYSEVFGRKHYYKIKSLISVMKADNGQTVFWSKIENYRLAGGNDE